MNETVGARTHTACYVVHTHRKERLSRDVTGGRAVVHKTGVRWRRGLGMRLVVRVVAGAVTTSRLTGSVLAVGIRGPYRGQDRQSEGAQPPDASTGTQQHACTGGGTNPHTCIQPGSTSPRMGWSIAASATRTRRRCIRPILRPS